MTFNIISDDNSLHIEGTGFFVSPTTAVTARHVLQNILTTRVTTNFRSDFVSCMFVKENVFPIRFHLRVIHMPDNDNLDFGLLHIPTELDIMNKIALPCPPHSYLPIGQPQRFVMSYVISMHPSMKSETCGIHVEDAKITRIGDGGSYCSTANLYPGDSGCPLLQNMHVVGIFLGPRNSTHHLYKRQLQTLSINEDFDDEHSSGSHSGSHSDSEVTHSVEKKKKKHPTRKELSTQFKAMKADLEMVSDSASELSRHHGHTFFLSFQNIWHLLNQS